MKLDATLIREIREINGDGTREAKFKTLYRLREAARDMSVPEIRRYFAEFFKKYDRATIAVCLAATIIDRRERLEPETVRWAQLVLKEYTNRPSDLTSLVIDDRLHPSRIEEYAGDFIKLTTEDGDGNGE